MPRYRLDPATVRVTSHSHHRNGISGKCATMVLFDWTDDDGNERKMLGVITDLETKEEQERKFNGECYILDVTLAAAGQIDWTTNAWRGDHFENILRDKVWELRRPTL
jgi:hypothetical protein